MTLTRKQKELLEDVKAAGGKDVSVTPGDDYSSLRTINCLKVKGLVTLRKTYGEYRDTYYLTIA